MYRCVVHSYDKYLIGTSNSVKFVGTHEPLHRVDWDTISFFYQRNESMLLFLVIQNRSEIVYSVVVELMCIK